MSEDVKYLQSRFSDEDIKKAAEKSGIEIPERGRGDLRELLLDKLTPSQIETIIFELDLLKGDFRSSPHSEFRLRRERPIFYIRSEIRNEEIPWKERLLILSEYFDAVCPTAEQYITRKDPKLSEEEKLYNEFISQALEIKQAIWIMIGKIDFIPVAKLSADLTSKLLLSQKGEVNIQNLVELISKLNKSVSRTDFENELVAIFPFAYRDFVRWVDPKQDGEDEYPEGH